MFQIMDKYLGRVSMYRAILYYLCVLIGAALVGSLIEKIPYEPMDILGNLLILAVSSWIINLILSKIFRTVVNFESQFITALILTLIVGPISVRSAEIWYLPLVALFAQASKYLLAFRKKHIFNPAAAAVMISSLTLSIGASWWGGDRFLLPFLIIGGIIILRKLHWFHLFFCFLVAYFVFLSGQMLLNGATFSQILGLNFASILSPLLFFSTIMLIEPLTAPPGKNKRMLYGSFIALILILLTYYSPYPYTLELALLIGNLAFWFTKTKQKLVLSFLQKEPVAQNIYAFWFEPVRKFHFTAGQFLEWTLPHPGSDARGTRRWFTIASSPTEKNILLTTKLAEKSSSFKSALNNLKPGQEISAINPDGDFVLPKDDNKKIVFIAGGIGITPFRSMTKYLIDQNQKRDIVLIYTAKNSAEFAFTDIFSAAISIGVKTIYWETEKQGFLTPEKIHELITDYADRCFYVSGPEPMVEAYQKMLHEAGIQNIKTDFFPGYEA